MTTSSSPIQNFNLTNNSDNESVSTSLWNNRKVIVIAAGALLVTAGVITALAFIPGAPLISLSLLAKITCIAPFAIGGAFANYKSYQYFHKSEITLPLSTPQEPQSLPSRPLPPINVIQPPKTQIIFTTRKRVEPKLTPPPTVIPPPLETSQRSEDPTRPPEIPSHNDTALKTPTPVKNPFSVPTQPSPLTENSHNLQITPQMMVSLLCPMILSPTLTAVVTPYLYNPQDPSPNEQWLLKAQSITVQTTFSTAINYLLLNRKLSLKDVARAFPNTLAHTFAVNSLYSTISPYLYNPQDPNFLQRCFTKVLGCATSLGSNLVVGSLFASIRKRFVGVTKA